MGTSQLLKMASGVGVNDECVQAFQDMKLNHKHRYIIYKLSDDLSEVEVQELGSGDSSKGTFDEFTKKLPEKEARYAVYDFEYSMEDDGVRQKLCFILWSPDVAKIKSKILYTSSKDAIRKKLQGISAEIQATDASEIAYEVVM